jgi:hypothetical protein
MLFSKEKVGTKVKKKGSGKGVFRKAERRMSGGGPGQLLFTG